MAAPVGVEDGPDAAELSGEGRVTQRLFDDLCPHVVGQRPAEHPAGVLISDGTQVGLAAADGHVRDIARPDQIKGPLVELAVDQVRGVLGRAVRRGRDLEQPRTHAVDPEGSHAGRHGVDADRHTIFVQVLDDPRGAVGAVAGHMGSQDPLVEVTTALLGDCRLFPGPVRPPLVEPRPGDLEQPGHA